MSERVKMFLQMLAEALCSILLLEESSPRQVFTEFLLARKAALQEIFHPSQHGTNAYTLGTVNILRLCCVLHFVLGFLLGDPLAAPTSDSSP